MAGVINCASVQIALAVGCYCKSRTDYCVIGIKRSLNLEAVEALGTVFRHLVRGAISGTRPRDDSAYIDPLTPGEHRVVLKLVRVGRRRDPADFNLRDSD